MVMMRGLVPSLEKHHDARVLEEAIQAAVRLSRRYLVGRQLPDKAVSVLDTACARLALGQSSTPPATEDAVRQLDDLMVQERTLAREAATGADHSERRGEIEKEKAAVQGRLEMLREHFNKERDLVARIRELRTRLEGEVAMVTAAGESKSTLATDDGHAATRADIDALSASRYELQVEQPLLRVSVDAQTVGNVVSAWTGIPVGKVFKDELTTILELEDHLGRRVLGQDHALESISERIRTSRASLDDPSRPVGVFLLVGSSGVGKTETALALSDLLYGGERNFITIDMSEFQEAHTVSTLKGSPPGYVGYGEGGVLTEAVRRRPLRGGPAG
jgi:type VI secretion system protein VasG